MDDVEAVDGLAGLLRYLGYALHKFRNGQPRLEESNAGIVAVDGQSVQFALLLISNVAAQIGT